MQTFLPFPSLVDSINTLQGDELDATVLAVTTVLNVLHETLSPEILDAYDGHPEVIKWRGHEPALAELGMTASTRLAHLDGLDDLLMERAEQEFALLEWHMRSATSGEYTLQMPDWFGNITFHQSEQAKLVRRNPEVYRPLFPTIDMKVAPVWPRA